MKSLLEKHKLYYESHEIEVDYFAAIKSIVKQYKLDKANKRRARKGMGHETTDNDRTSPAMVRPARVRASGVRNRREEE